MRTDEHTPKTKIFLYSAYAGMFGNKFREKNMLVEEMLDSVHPFAVVGEKEESMQSFLKGCTEISTIVSLKKNFKNMISRDEESYDSNYVSYPFGKNVVYSNKTDYLVITYIYGPNALYSVGNAIYSDVYPNNAFSEALKAKKRIPFPFPKDFNWKYYNNLFAEACMESYDSEHIILIRTNPAGYYCRNGQIFTDSKITSKMANQIRALEDDYIQRTHCHCIDDFMSYSPADKRIFVADTIAYDSVANSVADIIHNKANYKKDFYKFSQPLIQSIYQRLNDDALKMLEYDLKCCDEKVCVDIKRHFFDNNSSNLYEDLHNLKVFFDEDDNYGLLEYIKDKQDGQIDIHILELYTKYFKLYISDIVAVLLVYTKVDDKDKLKVVIQNICKNKNCYPITKSRERIWNNQVFLKKYKYIDEELKLGLNFDLDNGMTSFPVRISDNFYAIFNPYANSDMVVFFTWNEKCPIIDDVIENGMTCNAENVNALTRSWEFYIKRAKVNKGGDPLYLVFDNRTEFQQSLVLLDYVDVLENENAIITLRKNKQNFLARDFVSKCNLQLMMEDNVKIVMMRCGLGDQIQYYLLSKYLENVSGANVLYDDLSMILDPVFNGVEVHKLIKGEKNKEEFNKRRLSNIVSKRLMVAYTLNKVTNWDLADFLHVNGWDDVSGCVDNGRAHLMRRCSRFIIDQDNQYIVKLVAQSKINYYMPLNIPFSIFDKQLHIRKHLVFPAFTDDFNRKVEKEMLSCDAVVVHLRIGDMASLVGGPDLNFYRKSITSLQNIDEYKNIKFFVFSDDIPWCKAHESDIFKGINGSTYISYVTHNKEESSYLDMHLMSLGKIIIAGNSGFSFMAAVLSERKEVYVSEKSFRNGRMKQLGFVNKYELV